MVCWPGWSVTRQQLTVSLLVRLQETSLASFKVYVEIILTEFRPFFPLDNADTSQSGKSRPIGFYA